MDFEFDAPQFFDFDNPHVYEEAYNDTWFDNRMEDDIPCDADQKDGMARKAGNGIPAKPQRVRVPKSMGTAAPQSDSAVKMETSAARPAGDSSSQMKPRRVPVCDKPAPQKTERTPHPSPKKKQRLSEEEGKNLVEAKVEAEDQALVVEMSSPAANTRSRKRTSAESNSSPSASSHSEMEPASSPVQQPARSPVTRQQFKSPVAAKLSKSPTKGLRSPRKAVKSPYKAPRSPRKPPKSPYKAHKSPRKVLNSPYRTHRSGSSTLNLPKCASTGKLHRSNSKSEKRTFTAESRRPGMDMKTRSTLNLKGKTSEEIELERIATMQKELAKTRQQAQDSYKKAMKAGGYIPVRSTQCATLPQGFHFKTDGRLKNPQASGKDLKVKDFTKCLREALPQGQHLPSKPQVRGLTKPQPFKLSSAKSTNALHSNKYESDAEKLIAFQRRTPERFRTQPHGAKQRSRSVSKLTEGSRGVRSPSPGLTIAKTPNLTTRGRSRPVHTMSREEKERLEFEEHQKQQFKAHPVNHRILAKPVIGAPKAAPKPLTVTEEFNLHHKRAVSVEDLRSKTESGEKFEFHAKPVNPKILQGPVGVKPVEPLPPTVPQSPAFALKNRVRIPVEVPQVEETKANMKANPVPHPGIPFRPRLEHHHTVPEPFSVEERSKQMLTRRELKIQQVLEEERRAREFHAQGFPNDKPDTLPPKQERGITLMEPFQLSADHRGQRYKEEFFAKVEEEERQAKEAAQFKARPNHVIHQEPFLPQRSKKPLTEVSDFALNTDIRASQREAFDQQIKAREAELEGLKRQREERIEREEMEAMAKMRQAAVHKASGIKKYKSVIVKPSEKPLTAAQSPCFSQRVRTRHNVSDL
ncbi:targeting protein for Xklp2 isoform X2 [Aplysia californica]|uniref:Targeting protein for Xklp2 isoform X2 n=1 Tax=Aplysia californica TaxID=6500 RepID=A0ABM0JC71_APLCA|nr:targeting protein for Xklp2 isoform X2 [Aplysia californica]